MGGCAHATAPAMARTRARGTPRAREAGSRGRGEEDDKRMIGGRLGHPGLGHNAAPTRGTHTNVTAADWGPLHRGLPESGGTAAEVAASEQDPYD